MTTYRKADDRRQQMLEIACQMAEKEHYTKIRRHHLVERCNTAAGNVSRIMGSMEQMRTWLIEYALENDRPIVIAQAIMDKHPAVNHLTQEEKFEVITSCAI